MRKPHPQKMAANPQPSMKGPKPMNTASMQAAKAAHPAAKNLGRYLHPKKK